MFTNQKKMKMKKKVNRRNFIKKTGVAGLGLSLIPSILKSVGTDSVDLSLSDRKIRIGFVGIGARGIVLLQALLKFDFVEIPAICDIRGDRVDRAERTIVEAGRTKPNKYSRGDTDFERLCQKEDLDLVINATPWQWHTPICVSAMNNGKHTATEVPAALTTEQCWQLVEASEKNKKHCIMLENYCYFQNVMLVTNIVSNGLLGDIVHLEGRSQENWINENWHIFNSNGTLGWVGNYLSNFNGSFYSTHGIGPIATWAGINRGDQFEYLVSVSSKSVSVNNAAAKSFGKEHSLAKKEYKQGDANTTLIRSVNGKSFSLYYGGTSPQPWSPEYKAQGTKGACIGEMFDADNVNWRSKNIYLEGEGGRWKKLSDYRAGYNHPLWQKMGDVANINRVEDWSGTYDYLMFYQLLKALQTNAEPEMDVYDAACWSSILELSSKSVAEKGKPIDFPDFTKNKWKERKPGFFMNV